MDSVERQQIEEEYLSNNMRKLNRICSYLICRKRVPKMYEDELFSIGRLTFVESIGNYEASKNSSFQAYLIGNIWKAFYDWTRDNMRWKRCNLQRDKNGHIIRDQENNPIAIPDISLDALVDDGFDLCEKVASDFNMEEAVTEKYDSLSDESIEKYLSRLSKRQRKIVLLLYNGYRPEEIRDLLHISKREYADSMQSIRAYENIRILM